MGKNVKNILKKEFGSEPVYNEKWIKAKVIKLALNLTLKLKKLYILLGKNLTSMRSKII